MQVRIYDSWATKKLTFKNTPVLMVFKDIEELYKVKFKLDKTNFDTLKISTVFDNRTLKQVIHELEIQLQISIKEKDNFYITKFK